LNRRTNSSYKTRMAAKELVTIKSHFSKSGMSQRRIYIRSVIVTTVTIRVTHRPIGYNPLLIGAARVHGVYLASVVKIDSAAVD
jgi:hypothetical protein